MAIEKIVSGITGTSFRNTLNSNFAQLYPIIIGDSAPVSTIQAKQGQEYLNRVANELWICINITNNVSSWSQLESNDLYPIKIGTVPPTNSTTAVGIGQQYLDTTHNGYYICTSTDNNNFVWVMMNNDFILSTIVQNVAPTTSTVSDGIGQLYLNSATNILYICSNIDSANSIYTWTMLTKTTTTNQIIIAESQPSSQRINDYWFQVIE